MKKIILTLFIGIITVSLFSLSGCGSSEDQPPKPSQSSVNRRPANDHKERRTRQNKIALLVNVNDAAFRQLASDSPIFITCQITNSSDHHKLNLNQSFSPTPFCRSADGTAVPISTRRLTTVPSMVPKNGYRTIAWKLTSPLPPGDYEFDLATKGLITPEKGVKYDLRQRSAHLELSTIKALESETTYYQSRILNLSGDSDQALALLQQSLSQNPENIALQMELLDTLENLGEFSQARQQLISLAELMARRERDKNPEGQPHTPYWIINRDARLQTFEKIKKAKKIN